MEEEDLLCLLNCVSVRSSSAALSVTHLVIETRPLQLLELYVLPIRHRIPYKVLRLFELNAEEVIVERVRRSIGMVEETRDSERQDE